MKAIVALTYAEAWKAAAQRAIAEGREDLTSADLEVFATVDDAARAELEAAIKRASG